MPPEARDHEPPSRSTAAPTGSTSCAGWPPRPRAGWRPAAPAGRDDRAPAPLTAAAFAAAGLGAAGRARSPEPGRHGRRPGSVVNPRSATASLPWYERLPHGLHRLVARIQALATASLGASSAARDPAQVHATLIGLERAPDPSDPVTLAEHLRAVLAPPFVIQFGGFVPLTVAAPSRGLPAARPHMFCPRPGGTTGWPIVRLGQPCSDLADVRAGRAALWRHAPLRPRPRTSTWSSATLRPRRRNGSARCKRSAPSCPARRTATCRTPTRRCRGRRRRGAPWRLAQVRKEAFAAGRYIPTSATTDGADVHLPGSG